MSLEKWGPYVFLLGVVIALLVGILGMNDPTIIGLLALLGLIVGLVNITDKEITAFLVAVVALMLSANSLGTFQALLGADLSGMLVTFGGAMVAFVAPAAVVVSLKSIYDLASAK